MAGLTTQGYGQVASQILGFAADYSDLSSKASTYKSLAAMDYATADEAIAAGEISSRRQERAGERYLGSVRAAFAKAGVTSAGSPAMAAVATEAAIREDIIMTRLNAAKRASDLQFSALQKRIAAGQQRTRMWQAAGNTILSIGSSYALNQAGGNDAED